MKMRGVAVIGLGLLLLAGPVYGQDLLPPGTMQSGAEDPNAPSLAPDEPNLVLRVQRLESSLRTLNGQIEELQFQNKQLQEALRRLQEAGQPGAGAQANVPGAATNRAAAGLPAAPSGAAPLKEGDAFNPATQPTAPGVPRPLGIGPQPGLGIPKDPAAPMRLSSSAPMTTPEGTVIADNAAVNPREEFDIALTFLKQAQYADAEKAFRDFLTKHPKDKLAPDATYYLGDTFFERKRPREAAEQYLKVSTDYSTSAHAPEAMFRLGISLAALDAREQACATFQEIGHKYPNASAALKRGVEREIAKNKC